MPQRILVIDDETKICSILTRILTDEGYVVESANSGEQAITIVSSFDPVLILMDQNMPGLNGIDTMIRIKEKHPEKIVIMLTAYASIPQAVAATKHGAYDYLSKPFDNEELMIIIRRALEHVRLTEEIAHLKKQLHEKYDFKNFVGVSPQMQRIFEQIKRVCHTNATVLIQGESGTGKELVVSAIHYNSSRRNKPLVAINCGAVPVNLLESEFFGHEKGAFTDAKERKIGKFEQANGGTLLLDEIGELPLDAQVKLLRVLEENMVTKIGGSKAVPLDVRVIAATNKDLQEAVNDGSFRLDLLYRLNIFVITIPPLRERKQDIPLLIEHFINKHNKRVGANIESISRDAFHCLQCYSWPGNVRDLENAMESAIILAQDKIIEKEHLPLRVRGYPVKTEITLEDDGLDAQVRRTSAIVEKEIILKTMKECNGSRTKTADKLKISRKTLFNKIKQYEINQ